MRKFKLPGRDPSRPRLDEKDIELIKKQGIDKIKEISEVMVEDKLVNGKEIPRGGNPVYKAMHACNVSNRGELEGAHRIRKDRELKQSDINSIVNVIMRWIVREYNFYMEEEKEKQKSLQEF
ncbi:MAG: DUF4186 family protein [Nanohaloarchaea archaeon]|nr:DUF4186 family protein [Candidatus Nanohaloarchaea archaeon]